MVKLLERFKRKEKTIDDYKEETGYNPFLLAEIQPAGGVKFEESYVRKGDGYETCVHVYEYQTIVSDFWLEPIINMESVLVTIDIASANRVEMIQAINKAMAEQDNRHQTAKDNIDRIDARESYRELNDLYQSINQGEVMKRVHIRIFVSGKTLHDLEVNTKEVMDHLESYNFRGSVFLNEQEYEWESLVTSYDTQLKYSNKRKGKEIPALALAGGYPFHFTSLDDKYGTYYGTTDTNGSVVFDLFHRDEKRKFYNALMIGKMGTGKSTLLKKQVLDNAIKGHKVRILDVTGEFGDLVQALGGKTIALDGSQGIINPLQVFKTVTQEDGTPDEGLSFTQHLSKMSVFYRYINQESSHTEVIEFENLLRELYISRNLWSDDPDIIFPITSQKAIDYPIFSDLLVLVRESLYIDFETGKRRENLGAERETRLSNIELSINNLVQAYGQIFNGTSSIDDFNEEAIVSFPLRNLSNLKPEIFQAQIFNVMNMLWDGMIINGAPQFKSFNRKELKFEDAVRYLIILDEAHHIINTRDISQHAVLYLERFMREARKYFGGIFFASHLITDFVPKDSNQSNAENVKKLFQLTQYKFIAEQDAESLEQIQNVFEGQLTESEVRAIPTLTTGRVVLSISSVKNLIFNVDVSEEELRLFGGGA